MLIFIPKPNVSRAVFLIANGNNKKVNNHLSANFTFFVIRLSHIMGGHFIVYQLIKRPYCIPKLVILILINVKYIFFICCQSNKMTNQFSKRGRRKKLKNRKHLSLCFILILYNQIHVTLWYFLWEHFYFIISLQLKIVHDWHTRSINV